MSAVHFISVSRNGMLVARRKGGAPVELASATAGLEVEGDDESRQRGLPPVVRVRFGRGGSRLEVVVTEVVVRGASLPVQQFQDTFQVTDRELGRWIRAAVEKGLDQATNPVTKNLE